MESQLNMKHAMARIPTSASVVRVLNGTSNELIVAATISSLVSVSVSVEEEMVAFTLKNESYLGMKIIEFSNISISVLNQSQKNIALHYGSTENKQMDFEESFSQYWNNEAGFEFVDSSVIALKCKLSHTLVLKSATIYFANVERIFCEKAVDPLIYQDRNFGRFVSLDR